MITWIHSSENPADRHLVRAKLDEEELPRFQRAVQSFSSFIADPTPHPSLDETFPSFFRSLLSSPWLSRQYQLQPQEEFQNGVKRLLRAIEHGTLLVPQTLSLTREHRQGILARVVWSLDTNFEILHQLSISRQNAESLKLQAETASESARLYQSLQEALSTALTQAVQEKDSLREKRRLSEQELGNEREKRQRTEEALRRSNGLFDEKSKLLGETVAKLEEQTRSLEKARLRIIELNKSGENLVNLLDQLGLIAKLKEDQGPEELITFYRQQSEQLSECLRHKDTLNTELQLVKEENTSHLSNINEGLVTIATLQKRVEEKQVHLDTALTNLQALASENKAQREVISKTNQRLSDQADIFDDLRAEADELEAQIAFCKANHKNPNNMSTTGSDATNGWRLSQDLRTVFDRFLGSLTPAQLADYNARNEDHPATIEEVWSRIAEMQNPPNPAPACTHRRELQLCIPTATNAELWDQLITGVRNQMTALTMNVGPLVTELPGPPCNHEASLASTLFRPTGDWDALLAEVRRIFTPRAAATPAAPIGGGSTKLSFPTDPPELKGISENEWDSYSQTLEFWATGLTEVITPALCRAAIFQVLSFWKGQKLVEYAHTAGAANLVRDTWTETYEALIQWGDRRFISESYFTVRTMRWENPQSYMSPSDYASGEAFYLAFDNVVLGYKRVCQKKARDAPTERMITNKFLSLLPIAVRDYCLLHKASDTAATDFERASYWTHHRFVCAAWKTVNINVPALVREALPLAKIKRTHVDDGEESSDDEASSRLMAKRAKTGARCIFRYMGFDIPEDFRGKIRLDEGINNQLLRRLEKAGRCSTCRRTRKEHSNGSPFDDPKAYPRDEGRSVRWADAKEEENTPEATAAPIKSEENS